MKKSPLLKFLLVASILLMPSPTAHAFEDRDVDAAVVKALQFLSRLRNANGSWSVDTTGESTAATSLAVMAYLAAGHVPGEGPYGAHIDEGIRYVIKHQRTNGLIVENSGHGPMYDHGISTLMLAEVSGMVSKERSVEVRSALQKSIRLIHDSQRTPRKNQQNIGGWRYQANSDDSDLSVTGWQLLALRAAKDIGCDVPIEDIDLAVSYVKKCASGNGFGYQPRNGPTSSLTAAGILALQVCDHHDDESVHKGMRFLRTQPLRYETPWFFYGAYYQAISGYKYGGDQWEVTKSILFDEFLRNQQELGGWKASNGNEIQQGQIYATSLGVLALTVEYGYLPIYQR